MIHGFCMGFIYSSFSIPVQMHAIWGRITFGLPRCRSTKESAYHCRRCRRLGSIPGLERAPGGRKWQPTQYSCLENPMDRGAWQVRVCRAAKSRTRPNTCAHSTTLCCGVVLHTAGGLATPLVSPH